MSIIASSSSSHMEMETSLPMSYSSASNSDVSGSNSSSANSDSEEDMLHGTSWTRRSLIEDAKFETITNAEFEKQERISVSHAENEDDVITTTESGEVTDDVVFPVANGDALHNHLIGSGGAGVEKRKCTVVMSLRDISSLSRLFKHFENGRNLIQHVESRKSKKTGTALELLVTFETGRDNVANVLKSLRALSSVQDVTVLPEQDNINKDIPWFPRHITDLDKCGHLLTKFNPDLDQEHPGFTDPDYRERRKRIVEAAFEYRHGQEIPRVEYTDDETRCWGVVYTTLRELYEKHACAEFLTSFKTLERECGWSAAAIPQLQDVSVLLQRTSGFRLRPVAGLLSARDFLGSLAFRVFQCTQYLRHPSKPDHTVEPDCIHELLGHVPMLTNPGFAQFSQEIGLASLGASDEDIEKFATIYWFTVEFGLCRQNGDIKAYGAGLLSAYGEFNHALSDVPDKRPFEPTKVAVQKYDDQNYQEVYFVCESFADMTEKVRAYARNIKRPYEVRYDPYTQSIQVLDNKHVIQNMSKILKIELNTLHAALHRIESISLSTD